MQNKIQIRKNNAAPLFHKAALQFVLEWKERMRVDVGWIEQVERVAASPSYYRWPRHMAAQDFQQTYWKAPNLAAALINFLRQKWAKLESSKPGKLKKFMAENPTVPWDHKFNTRAAVKEAEEYEKRCQERRPPENAPIEIWDEWVKTNWDEWEKRKHSGPTPSTIGDVPVCELEDSQIVVAFEKLPGSFSVTKAKIREARREVIKDHRAGELFAKRVLDKDGFLQVEGKPRRRKKRIARTSK